MLRPLALFLLVPALFAQDSAPNFEVVVPDLPGLIRVSKSLPAARAMAEPSYASYLSGELGVESAGEFVATWVEGYLPGVAWADLAEGVRSLRMQGFATKLGGDGDWMLGRLTTGSSEVAADWFAKVAAEREAARMEEASELAPPALPATLEGATWLGDDLWLTQQGADLVLGFQKASLDQGLRAFAEPLGSTLLEPRAGAVPILEARGRFGLLIESFLTDPMAPDQLASFFDGLGDAHAHMRMDAVPPQGEEPGRIVTRLRRDPSSSTQSSSLESMVGIQPLDPAWMKGLPQGAMFTCVTTVDASKAIPAILAGNSGAGFDWGQLENELGFPLQRIWDQMGPRMTLWSQPIGGPSIPPTFAMIGLKDPEAFGADWDAFLGVLAAQSGDVELRTRDYKVKDATLGKRIPIPITTVRSSALSTNVGGMDLSANPAMCIDDGTFLVASSSSRLKKELKRRHAGEANLGLDLSQRLASAGLEGATTAWQFDYVAMLDGLLGLARLAGGMGGDMVPVDLSNLPSTAPLAKHVRPTFHAQGVDEKGRWILHEASFGPETWLALTGAVTQAMRAMMTVTSEFADPSTIAPAGVPLGGGAGGAGPVQRTNDSLSDLRVGITIYEISIGQSPETLDALLTKTADFPQGFLDTEALPTDGWGNAFLYERQSENQFRLWSAGPNGVDEKGAGDDLVSP